MTKVLRARRQAARGAAVSRPQLKVLVGELRGILDASGSLPSERALAERLDAKRHHVRRALEVLRANGEVSPTRSGRKPATPLRAGEDIVRMTNPIEIIELRLVLEPALARLAALRASPAEIARIQRTATTAPGADPGQTDLAFHTAVASGARNSLADGLYTLIRQIAKDARQHLGIKNADCPKRLQRRDAEHKAIADAIAARQPEAAELAMRVHLTAVQRAIVDRLALGIEAA